MAILKITVKRDNIPQRSVWKPNIPEEYPVVEYGNAITTDNVSFFFQNVVKRTKVNPMHIVP